MTLRAVQYHPEFCEEAKADMEKSGPWPWRWDASHDLSVIDDDGVRHYIGSFGSAGAAYAAGLEIEKCAESGTTKDANND